MATPPRPRQAIEADLAAIPALRAAHTHPGDPAAELLTQDIIDRRVDRLLDELLAHWTGASR